MNMLIEAAVDVVVVVVLFCMVGGASHRNGGTCEQPKDPHAQVSKK